MAGIDSFVVFGCHFNDGNAVASSTDFSLTSPKTITFNGNATCSTGATKFGASVLKLDGTDDYLSLADSNDWDRAAGAAYSAECWVNLTSTGVEYYVMGNMDISSGTTGWGLFINSDNTLKLEIQGSIIVTAAHGMSSGTWYHIAWDIDASDNARLYVAGTQIGSTGTFSGAMSCTNSFLVGTKPVGLDKDFNGYIDEIRISKGVQRWGGNFTPPTAEYSATSNSNLLMFC